MTQATVNETAKAPVSIPEPIEPQPPEVVAKALPEGKPFECDPSPAMPGEIVQIIAQFPANTVLKGLVVGEGLVVRTVLVGRFRYPASEADSWESCLGKAVPDQAFVILLVENVTHETMIARATWYVSDGGSQTASAPHPMASPPPPMQPSLFAGKHAPAVAQKAAAPASGPKTVTPGTNEVAILLQRAECERLLWALTGGDPVEHQYQPSIIRQLHAALAR
jgi:hypothetical protein